MAIIQVFLKCGLSCHQKLLVSTFLTSQYNLILGYTFLSLYLYIKYFLTVWFYWKTRLWIVSKSFSQYCVWCVYGTLKPLIRHFKTACGSNQMVFPNNMHFQISNMEFSWYSWCHLAKNMTWKLKTFADPASRGCLLE